MAIKMEFHAKSSYVVIKEKEIKWLYPDFPTSPVTFGVQDGPGFPRVET
jgi:hypothetical protein